MLTPHCSAASGIVAPSPIASTARLRKSSEYGFAIHAGLVPVGSLNHIRAGMGIPRFSLFGKRSKELRRAEAAGAVNLAPGGVRSDDQVAHVRLEAANALYRHLGRTPIAGIASEAHARTIDGL